MTVTNRNLDSDLRAIGVSCPTCLVSAGRPCYFLNGEDPDRWVHAARGLAFWRRRTPSATVDPS